MKLAVFAGMAGLAFAQIFTPELLSYVEIFTPEVVTGVGIGQAVSAISWLVGGKNILGSPLQLGIMSVCSMLAGNIQRRNFINFFPEDDG